ncbi:hypothetical protein DID80_03620 [Candidatus Marinamargulisbacteria bacterium SCGC AAA071-K20]|nr:hypothetical protein DID80_03620 [Candidatus Marinamargulisbacteria bacterium SCGC AAA071-K20]
MANQNGKVSQIKNELKNISMFSSEQNKQIQNIKSEIYMLSDVCKKESELFKTKFGNEWKNLASVQHTLKVINTNLLLLNKKIELSDTFIADIYGRLTKISTLIEDSVSLDEVK